MPAAPHPLADGVAFVRGAYVPIAEAAIPITDWGFLRSDATYDVVTVWDGAFFRLDAHLERFMRSCERFRLDPGLTPAQITEVLSECVRRSGLRNSYVEMIVTRGQPPWGSRDPRQAVNRFYAFAVPFVWIANEAQRERGLHLKVSTVQRIPAGSVDPTAKNYHWNDLTMGLLGALDAGADTVVLSDAQGNVVEGPGFNIFCVKDGALVTPKEGVLEGISRRTVIEIARGLGLPVELRALPAEELRGADEAFLTSSGGGVLPVTRVDDQVLGAGRPGSVTQRLLAVYWDLHRDPTYSQPIDFSRTGAAAS
ncbi:aminotransferase class IV [Variovorax sp. RA8]|uniref:aminotransferase class IV n=1 Tax=Variovorax sp. (strain JCM 16519 / RA8) TaxID=662548 RepID=UPI001316E32D|nr:aminotransferase class IV [Variovorax sp. RA8]VTU23213.1 Branched-chain-amino-acid aminotransferase [Variovorax sp. RA8]